MHHYMALAAIALSSMVMNNYPKDTSMPIARRVAATAQKSTHQVKDMWNKVVQHGAVKFLRYSLGNDSLEAQQYRLDLYRKLDPKKHHPKRYILWIITGRMPVINPDGRVSDIQYQEYYVLYKRLIKGEELTHDETAAAREEAMQVLREFKQHQRRA